MFTSLDKPTLLNPSATFSIGNGHHPDSKYPHRTQKNAMLSIIFWLIWFINQTDLQLCFVVRCHWYYHRWHWHWWCLCTPVLATSLNIKPHTWYTYAPMSLIYAHQIFNDSAIQFLNGSQFSILFFDILPILTIIETSYCIYLCSSSLPTYTKRIMPL